MNEKEAIDIWKGKTEFSHGKRGTVSISKDKKYLIKERRSTSTSPGTIRNEYEYNLKLNKIGVGPRIEYYCGENDFLIREFINGKTIYEHLNEKKEKTSTQNFRAEIHRIVLNILEQCRRMDGAQINKFEMTNPYKDLIIDEKSGEQVIIDFERCRHSENPKNVTQFCQFLLKGKMRNELEKVNVLLDSKKIISLAEEYKRKQSDENYKKIKKEIEEKFKVNYFCQSDL